ncbi:MAG: nucleotide exchange factor GrpE [Nitrososphaeria archaeon]|nr:nucleotide exchange factor GrpE [Nitrososphaeria archaeon]
MIFVSDQNKSENHITEEKTQDAEAEQLKQSLAKCEDALKRSLADFINLERKTKSDIENGIATKMDKFLLRFLTIYDDLVRAKEVLKKENPEAQGLDGILKNIDSLLVEYGVSQISALGELFDPNLHEAIAITNDDSLDDNTITKELRKGYISHNRTLRPTLVEISKKSQ